MSNRVIRSASMQGSYGPEICSVILLGSGRLAGRYVPRGYPFAGRIAYRDQRTVERMIERCAQFQCWEA